MAIVDPVLFIDKFFLYPYHIRSEKSINLELADKEVIIRGRNLREFSRIEGSTIEYWEAE
ncbi:MAG: hypothetical protein MGF17_10405 [Trichodesmium sp. MAG_R04]|nr:hypothetical protein [Trichodesmium sp. MAG_R04]